VINLFKFSSIKACWFRHRNFGDTLTPVILEHFSGKRVRFSKRPGKMLAVGSVIDRAKDGDIIWGTGLIRDEQLPLPNVSAFAVRGPLTARNCRLQTEIYGDPAILLPLLYNPRKEKKHRVGVIPHYVDKDLVRGEHVINIEAPWRQIIDSVLECEKIVSSSLHGIIAAEAYGIPAEWKLFSNRIIGGEFKFHDYLLGTGRKAQPPGELPPIEDLDRRQNRLLEALHAALEHRN
jgi:pyruvyltransferase